jgi:cell division protein FtsX
VTAAWMMRRARRQLSRERGLMGASTAVFLLLVLVGGATLLAVRATRGWMSTAGQGVSVLVFLRDATTAEQAAQMATLLRRSSGVAQVRVVEPDEALARVRDSERHSGSAGWMDDLEPGYFPRSLELALVPSGDISQRAAQIAQRLRGLPGVVQVDSMGDGVARLGAWVRFGQRLGWTVAVIAMVMAVVLLIGVVMRGRESRARNLQVLLLLGETKSHARIPSNVLLAISGFLGATGALVALRLAWPVVLTSLEHWLGLSRGAPVLLGAGESALCLVTASALGWFLGYLSTPILNGADA